MRRSAPLLLVVLLASAGCATANPAAAPAPAAAAATPEAEPTEWAESVCGALAPFVALTQQEQTPPADPAAAVEQLRTKAAEADTALEGTLAALDRVGPSPVQDGDAFVAELSELFTTMRGAFAEVGRIAGEIDPSNPATAREQLKTATEPFATTPPNVDFTRFDSNTELQELLERSPSCEDVTSLTGA